ncbi:hypothetical protein [Bacillus paramycoides]|uniref:hypothetical protein n=1 Tax=Bacillus paramycoides TaxID=2026194 RepID=UPI003D161F94
MKKPIFIISGLILIPFGIMGWDKYLDYKYEKERAQIHADYEKEQTRSLQKTTQPSQETTEPQEQSEQEKTKNDPPTTTEYTLQQLKEAFPVGMEFNQYVEKKKTMNVDNPFSISLKKGNVGSVIQGKDGLLVVCVDGNKIFDLKTFSSIDEVKSYEQSLRGK